MNITQLRLWVRNHDLIVTFEADGKTYQADPQGLRCHTADGSAGRVTEGQMADVIEANPDTRFRVGKRALQGLGRENVWTLDELAEAIVTSQP